MGCFAPPPKTQTSLFFFFFKKKQNRIPTLEYLSVFIMVVSALSLEAGSVFK